MTLIAGLICKDAIVLAGDTLVTDSIAKTPHADKLHVIEFANLKVLVAESGLRKLSGDALERIRNKANGRTLQTDDEVARVVREAVGEVRTEQMQLYPGPKNSEEELRAWKNFFQVDMPFELTFAYYWDDKPRLHTISVDDCICDRCRSYFVTSGIGRDLADYLLATHANAGMSYWVGSYMLSFVIEMAKKYVRDCGGDTHIALIRPQGDFFRPCIPSDRSEVLPLCVSYADEEVAIFSVEYIKEMAAHMAHIMKQANLDSNKRINSVLTTQDAKIAGQMKKSLEVFMAQMKEKYGLPPEG